MKMDELTSLLKQSVKPAQGCTEPIAIAYALAIAKDEIIEEIKKIEIIVSLNIYKNALRVGIPGTNYKGPIMAAALSLVMGDYSKELKVIEGVEREDIEKAKKIIDKNIINLKVRDDINGLYIETRVITSKNKSRVIIVDNHLNVVKNEKIDKYDVFDKYTIENNSRSNKFKVINDYSLKDILDYINKVPLKDIAFLNEGINMNLKVAKEGLESKNSLSGNFRKFIENEFLGDNMVSKAQMLASAASEARMNGSKLPIMSSAGSGNQGIVNFITNHVVAENENITREKLIRGLALSNLLTLYIKTATGSLSAMCGVAVAAGAGVSASTAYILGGEEKEIFSAILNVLGALTGMVCDGAKEGCAYKVASASSWSIISAKLAIEGKAVNYNDGILAENFDDLINNLAHICNPGMIATDEAMLDIMHNNKKDKSDKDVQKVALV